MSDELKPCPFCGGEAEITYYRAAHIPQGKAKESERAYACRCVSCGCEAPGHSIPSDMSSKREAIETWNTRTNDNQGWKEIIYDGCSVYQNLSDNAKRRTSPENVSDVLDAIARIMKTTAQGVE